MLKAVNYINAQWNRFIFWFHDASTRTNIKWLVNFSIWVFDKMVWNLPSQYQLVGGITLKEHELRYQLYLARHQIQYWTNYAYDLQKIIIEEDFEELPKVDGSSRPFTQLTTPVVQRNGMAVAEIK